VPFCVTAGVGPTETPSSENVPETDFLASAGDGFQLRRSPHFLIAYDTEAEALNAFMTRVEATYRTIVRFLDAHDVPSVEPEQPMRIYFFARHDDFHAFAARRGADAKGAYGYYSAREDYAAFFDAKTTPELVDLNRRLDAMNDELRSAADSGARAALLKQLRQLRNLRDRIIATTNLLVVQHEVAHQVFYSLGLHARGGDNPPWLVEGLACLFETPAGPDGTGIGAVNQDRLVNLHEALTGSRRPVKATYEDYQNAVQAGRVVSLRQLVTDKTLFQTAGENAANHYAQAWSLVHYLQRRRGEAFGEYLTVMAKRPADRGYTAEQELMQFEYVFGPIDEKFERQWLEYILSLDVRWPQ
jgi:hypothetical protein